MSFQYWGLDANEVERCCWMTYTQHRDTQEVLNTLDKLDIDDDDDDTQDRKVRDAELYKRFGWEDDFHNVCSFYAPTTVTLYVSFIQ